MVNKISSEMTLQVRHMVLRQGKPIESCSFLGDDLPSTSHFGYTKNDEIIGVVSVFKQNNILFKTNDQYQIRGMAILENHQKKGIGKELILTCENYIKINSGNLIWFNARISAVEFYKKMNYDITGEPFEIKDIGTHYLMRKCF